ncbi:MAG: Uma2 family endonuclease [Alsobacter sp.]
MLDLPAEATTGTAGPGRQEDEVPMRSATTRAAEGFLRRAFTVAEVEAMQEQGIFHPDEKFELVEGEIVPLQSKSPVHEMIKETLNRLLVRNLPDGLWVGVERTIFLSPTTALDPDISLFEERHKAEKVDGPRLILAIEVSHSALAYDKGLKARLYSRYGVPEYWVIDVKRRRTIVHRGPKGDKWESIEAWGEDVVLAHPAVPGFSLRLSEV